MTKTPTEYLFRNFNFFGSRTSPQESNMCFGFECNDGWFGIIKKLCQELKALKPKGLVVTQVKEKYGGLRFYYNGPSGSEKLTKQVEKLVRGAEAKSLVTCEDCGKKGRHGETTYGYWVYTCCKEHEPEGFRAYVDIKKSKSQKA